MNAQKAPPTRQRTQPPWTIARRRQTTPLRRLCSAAKQTSLDTLPNLDDHRFEDWV